jgi:hypothetical protein
MMSLRLRCTGSPRRHGGALVAGALSVLLSAATVAGCTSARNTLGTSASPCFDSLAIAASAVHHRGTFAGVRQVSLTQIGNALGMRSDLGQFGRKVHTVCVVSYHGTFSPAEVQKPLGPPPIGGHGHFAIVIVAKPQNHLVGTVVRLLQLPGFRDSL